MEETKVLCVKAGSYNSNLTRGKTYAVVEVDKKKRLVRVIDNNGRSRFYEESCFDFNKDTLNSLVDWKYDDKPEEINESYAGWVEVTIFMSDGTKRWCKLITPELLNRMLKEGDFPPGFVMNNYIAIRSLDRNDIDTMLKYLDEENELELVSIPY